MKRKNLSISLSLSAALLLPTAAGAGNLILAKDGKSSYHLSVPEKSNPVETEAIKDFKEIFKKITGSGFSTNRKGNTIFIGKKPATDTRPFSPRERRIRSVGQDIYLYGEGEYGAAFAIYDFLEKKLGCRWYSMFGVEKIPQRKDITLEEFAVDIKPSFYIIEPGLGPLSCRKSVYRFMRRNRMHILPLFEKGEIDDSWQYIGPTCHSLGYYLPPGDITKRKGGRMGPSPYLKDKKYFKTNPEFFTLRNGKRRHDLHYCFSNPAMRKEMQKNIDLVLSKEYTPGRKALVALDINDFNGPLCECDNCMAIVKKHGGAEGAPFFEFVIETANLLKDKWPDVYFKFIVYGLDMTLKAPKMPPESFPENVIASMSMLTNDVSKSFYSKTNKFYRETFIEWSKLVKTMASTYTPVHWSYPSGVMSLAANIDRLIRDMRFMYKHKLRIFKSHYSELITETYNFRELQLFLMSRLGEDINADADALIKEFCDAMYGAAADDMIQYIRELDAAANADPRFYRWNSSPKTLSYVTPENIMKWQKHFDKMVDKVKDDPEVLLRVNTARMDLDQNMVYNWREIVKKYPELKGQHKVVADRYRANSMADARNRSEKLGKGAYSQTVVRLRRLSRRGIDFAEKTADPKPLPEAFSKFAPGTVFDTFPEVENDFAPADPKAAAGFAIEMPMQRGRVLFAYQDNGVGGSVVPNTNNTKWSAVVISKFPPFHPDNAEKLTTGYRFYYLGRVKLTYDCSLFFRRLINLKRAAAFAFGPAFDPKDPEALFDLYISMKKSGDKNVKIDRMVAVKVQPGSKDAGIALNKTTSTVKKRGNK